MAEAAKRRQRARRWQGRIAVILFTLFPLAVVAGLLSPGIVGIESLMQTAENAASGTPPLDFQSVNVGHSPLLVPRDFSAGFIPELLDLDQLFRESAFRVDPEGERLARLLAFPRSHGDAIVLDDVDANPPELLFDDALVGDTIAPVPGELSDAFGLGSIASSIPLGNRVRFDDFPNGGPGSGGGGGGAPIPEPSTGALIAFGLGALGLRRRS